MNLRIYIQNYYSIQLRRRLSKLYALRVSRSCNWLNTTLAGREVIQFLLHVRCSSLPELLPLLYGQFQQQKRWQLAVFYITGSALAFWWGWWSVNQRIFLQNRKNFGFLWFVLWNFFPAFDSAWDEDSCSTAVDGTFVVGIVRRGHFSASSNKIREVLFAKGEIHVCEV